MNSNDRQLDFFVKQLFVAVLFRLDIADESDMHPSMLTKMRIRDIEDKLIIPWSKRHSKVMIDIEDDRDE